MRIFTASLATETNTFAPTPTGRSAFENGIYFPGGSHPDHPTPFAGPLWAARERAKERGWTVIEGLVAAAWPSGNTTRQVYEDLRDQILADLRAALPVDMVVLGMHGAMVAEGYDDCEGDLLARAREIVGPDVSLGATLDPHGHLTEVMVDSADLLISWKEYPHTDIYDRAFELVDILTDTLEGRCRPVPALVDCEMIALIFTTQEPGLSLVARQRELEQLPGVLSVSLNHGFPWGDVPGMGTKVLVYANDNVELARRTARTMADEVIAAREALRIDHPELDVALDRALASATQPVVIADGADNAGGGAGSDSTFFLRRMLERGISNAALGPMWDPQVVDLAFQAGVGAKISVRLGGKCGPMSGDPLDVEVTVRALAKKHSMGALVKGDRLECGDSAWLTIEGVEVIVTSLRIQAIGTDLFTGIGCELSDKRIIVVKSTQHFYAQYAPLAGQVIYGRAPGAVSTDLDSFGHRHIQRPKWPLREQAGTPAAPPPLPTQEAGTNWVTSQIADLARRCGAVVGVCAYEVGTDRRIEYQANMRFTMASTFKVALACAVLQAVDRGELRLSEMIELPRASQIPEGVVSMMFVQEGIALSVANLLEVMMSDSDNSTTDVLMARVGGASVVQRVVDACGVRGLRVDRNCEQLLRDYFMGHSDETPLEAAARVMAAPDFDPASFDSYNAQVEADERDTTTPAAMAQLLGKIVEGRVLSADSLALLEGMMLRAQTQRRNWIQRLKAKMPAGTHLAHKGGTLTGALSDVGWLRLPAGRCVVMAVYTRHGITPRPQREHLIEEIGRLLYSAFQETEQRSAN